MTTRLCIENLYARALFEPSVAAPFGGTEVQLAELARRMAAREGWQVTVTAGNFGQPAREHIEGIDFVRSITPGQTSLPARALNSWRYWSAWKRANADIYLASADAGTVLWRLAQFCRRYKKRLVNRISSDSYVDPEFLRQDERRAKLYGAALKGCDMVVVQNRLQAEALRDYFGIFPLTVGSMAATSAEEVPRAAREHVLWVGRARTMKRPEVFLDLCEALPQLAFTMVISRDEPDLLEAVRREAARLSNLTLKEDVRPANMADLYRRAVMLVNTSDYEGFPSTFVEAFAAGAPVVSLHADPDGLLSGGLGINAKGDREDLVAAVRMLASDDERWTACHTKALEHAREHHDPDRVTDRYEELFRRVLEKGRAR